MNHRIITLHYGCNISIIGGLLLSQMLTLYTTPVVYLYLDRARHRFNRWRGVRTDAALENPL